MCFFRIGFPIPLIRSLLPITGLTLPKNIANGDAVGKKISTLSGTIQQICYLCVHLNKVQDIVTVRDRSLSPKFRYS